MVAMPHSDPEKRRAYQKAYYAKWLALNRERNNLVRRTRYKYDVTYRARCRQHDQRYRRRKRAEVPTKPI